MFTIATVREMWANAWPVISVLLFCSVLSGAIILERWFSLAGLPLTGNPCSIVCANLYPTTAASRRPPNANLSANDRPRADGFAGSAAEPFADREALERLGDRLVARKPPI